MKPLAIISVILIASLFVLAGCGLLSPDDDSDQAVPAVWDSTAFAPDYTIQPNAPMQELYPIGPNKSWYFERTTVSGDIGILDYEIHLIIPRDEYLGAPWVFQVGESVDINGTASPDWDGYVFVWHSRSGMIWQERVVDGDGDVDFISHAYPQFHLLTEAETGDTLRYRYHHQGDDTLYYELNRVVGLNRPAEIVGGTVEGTVEVERVVFEKRTWGMERRHLRQNLQPGVGLVHEERATIDSLGSRTVSLSWLDKAVLPWNESTPTVLGPSNPEIRSYYPYDEDAVWVYNDSTRYANSEPFYSGQFKRKIIEIGLEDGYPRFHEQHSILRNGEFEPFDDSWYGYNGNYLLSSVSGHTAWGCVPDFRRFPDADEGDLIYRSQHEDVWVFGKDRELNLGAGHFTGVYATETISRTGGQSGGVETTFRF